MGKTEIYECDRCHKKATTKAEQEILALGTITVGFDVSYPSYSYSYPTVRARHQVWKQELCMACRAEIGCLEDKIREADKADNANVPSLEDMVREIVRQEIPQQNQ